MPYVNKQKTKGNEKGSGSGVSFDSHAQILGRVSITA
jgi:hypothetical protein